MYTTWSGANLALNSANCNSPLKNLQAFGHLNLSSHRLESFFLCVSNVPIGAELSSWQAITERPTSARFEANVGRTQNTKRKAELDQHLDLSFDAIRRNRPCLSRKPRCF